MPAGTSKQGRAGHATLASVAFAIIAAADVAETFPVESAYTWVFALGGLGAALVLLTSALMPSRTVRPAAEKA